MTLEKEQGIDSELLAYINRLSDLLFVLARVLTKNAGEKEVYWKAVNREQ